MRELVWLRRETPLLRLQDYVHDRLPIQRGHIEIRWINAAGEIKRDDEWSDSRSFSIIVSEHGDDESEVSLAISINGSHEPATLELPAADRAWRVVFASGDCSEAQRSGSTTLTLGDRTIALLRCEK